MGWPYVSPGTNDQNGIDCSGLFVKMYRDQGAKIYHGSNTIFHEYCSSTGALTSVDQLRPGMAVFKRKDWTDADKGNKWYGKDPGNLSHIGYVDSVNPLRIIHASSVSGYVIVDTKIGKWAYWGMLKDVDYGGDPGPSPDPEPSPDPGPSPEPEPSRTMYTFAENGKPINLRVKASTKAALVDKVPVGQAVTRLKEDGTGWAYVQWKKKKGWMLECFLVEDPQPEPDPDPEPDPGPEPDPDPPVETTATVWADNGKPIKMRAQPTTSCRLYDELPVNTEVEVIAFNCVTDSKGNQWTRVNYRTRKGWYIMTKFLGVG